MDLCRGGDLLEYIVRYNADYTEVEVALIIQKILLGLAHIHNSNICHRDLKPENIMFEEKAMVSELKIIDLGLSRQM
jgi:serine/threonine protein kinase